MTGFTGKSQFKKCTVIISCQPKQIVKSAKNYFYIIMTILASRLCNRYHSIHCIMIFWIC